MNDSERNFCDTVAEFLIDSLDTLNDLISSLVELGANTDTIIKTVSAILEDQIND